MWLQERPQHVKGRVILESVVGPLDKKAWKEFSTQHCVDGDELPYATTFGWVFRDPVRFSTHVVSTAPGQVWAIAAA